MFKRILKTLGALLAGHGIQTLTQLLVPPAFIAAYGVKGYGEWLVLSAAVGYLGTLDFGLQTYVLNELTALYHRNEIDNFHRVQSVGLWLMLFFVAGGTILAGSAFFLPVAQLLKVSGPPADFRWAMFFLALQILVSIPMGQILGIYRTFGRAHRGAMWGNLYRLLLLVVTISLAWLRAPFWLVAAGQVVTAVGILLAVIFTLSWSNPAVSPRLDYWDRGLARQILKPSAFFGLFLVNNFLVYQAPILLLQRFLGAQAVVIFSVTRTLFSFVRQGVALLQQAVLPEITRLYGLGEQEKLAHVYVRFEALLFTSLLIANAGLLLAAPALLSIWLKRPELYHWDIFVTLMVVSILASVKEYKLYFQYATNNHSKSGGITLLVYLGMCLVSVPGIHWFGLLGFLLVWTIVEAVQVGVIHACNTDLFRVSGKISIRPALRLGLTLTTLIVCTFFLHQNIPSQSLIFQSMAAVSAMIILAATCYFLFDLKTLMRESRIQLASLWIR